MGACADTMFLDPEKDLSVRSGETLTLSFDLHDDPERLSVQAHEEPGGEGNDVGVSATNPSSFEASFGPGEYWLLVGSWWSEDDRWTRGDASSYFKIRVS